MSEQLRLERNVPGLLEDLYVAGTPNYRNDVLAAVARTRQRPAWTFPERWIPMVDIATRPAFAPRVPIRLLIVLALLAAVAMAAIAYIGSQQRNLPAPFGPARNGLVVTAVDGDLFTIDPVSGERSALLAGPDVDRKPYVSPDGTRVVFLRGLPSTPEDDLALATIDIDGDGFRILEVSNVGFEDPITWSPDSDYVLRTDGDFAVHRYDLDGGAPTVIARDAFLQADAFQPPSGDKILFESPTAGRSLWLMNADGSGSTKIYEIPPAEIQDGCDFGLVRWSPDGSRIAFLRRPVDTPSQCRIFVMNADGTGAQQLTTTPGEWTETDFRWSPDGTQIAFDRWKWNGETGEWLIWPLGVVAATGGEVRSVGPTPVADGAAIEWSPDGKTILSLAGPAVGWSQTGTGNDLRPILIDVATGEGREASWSLGSWPTWQRLAPE